MHQAVIPIMENDTIRPTHDVSVAQRSLYDCDSAVKYILFDCD